MIENIVSASNEKSISNNRPLAPLIILENLKKSIWIFGIPFCLFEITTKISLALFKGFLSFPELVELVVASLLFFSWLCLKPETIQTHHHEFNLARYQGQVNAAKTRMAELEDYHLISQVYTLPFPYLCQIYHLLNLKHLESVHNVSLGNLKIVGVNHCYSTETGGALKFQTILNNSVNALRMWRQPTVEAELILHTPFTVELCIPVYNGKKIIVIFNVLPLSNNEHKFFVDIYSDLEWHKPLLQIILHFAACWTLIEDLPYLRTLAQKNLDRLIGSNHISSHLNMWLFRRFVELYGSSYEIQAT